MIEITLWQYSRTHRKHWIDAGELYNPSPNGTPTGYLWEIVNCTPCGFCNQIGKEGYDLYHKGKRIKHAKTVKELKGLIPEKEQKRSLR